MSQRKVLAVFQWRVWEAASWEPHNFIFTKSNRKHILAEVLVPASLFSYKRVAHTHTYIWERSDLNILPQHTHNMGSFTGIPCDDRIHRHPDNKISLTAKSESLFGHRNRWALMRSRRGGKAVTFKTSTDEPTRSTQTFGLQTASNSLICHARQEIFHAKMKTERDINFTIKIYCHSNM